MFTCIVGLYKRWRYFFPILTTNMDKICFTVNKKKCYVGCDMRSDVMLVDYLRNYMELRGTKYMCREGGCGACIVMATRPGKKPAAVNSCLVAVTSCHNWDITTIEKVGNRKDGYHPIQKALVEEHGTQCGHCSPGWVMAMYCLLKNNNNMTELDIEKSFGSNICRCTGYRSILDAFKKFAVDSPKQISIPDMEDLETCNNFGSKCEIENCADSEWCFITKGGFWNNVIEIDLKDNKTWYRATKLQDIFDILRKIGNDLYMLVCGNTAKGAYPMPEAPLRLIDISGVSELQGSTMDQNLVINANTTLTKVIEILDKASEEDNFHYLKVFYDHFQFVAHSPVRNLATLAGNLMIKHKHHEFTSDVFLLAETVDAQLIIRHYSGKTTTVNMQQFLKTDMKGKVILKVLFPPLVDEEYKCITFKIMPRAQNAHAVVNAGFLFRLKSDGTVRQSRIVYSGLTPPSTRASVTEIFLKGKKLFTNETVQGAIKILEKELVATENPPEPCSEYRKRLAVGLFYKGILKLCPPEKIHYRYQSGSINLYDTRSVSKGQQIYETDPDMYPLTQPVQKVEAMSQCSGEAIYSEDIPAMPDEVFAAFVLSTEATGNIVNIDPSEALNEPGVIAFFKASDIPGVNSYIPVDGLLTIADEEVLANGKVHYYNEPLGIIVAESRALAERVAQKVKVTYTNVKKPVIDIKDAIKDKERLTQYNRTEATDKGSNVVKVIKGQQVTYYQQHVTMETILCVVKPTDQGLEVHIPTQWMDGTQIVISRALKMDMNCIDVYTRRVGGAYGSKITRVLQPAVACSLVAKTLNRPCRMINSMSTNLRAVGKRAPVLNEFEVGINESGVIQYVDQKLYTDSGHKTTEALFYLGLDTYYNTYKKSKWGFTGFNVLTDTAKNTWCRSPGSFETIAMAELIMEQMSCETSIDPIEIRLANLDTDKYEKLMEMVDTLKTKSDYDARKLAVEKFNSENRWKKRGLGFAKMQWGVSGPFRYDAHLAVYHEDGSVVVTHSGIEMGQGINTKVIQIVAYFLKISIEKIKVKGQDSISGANGFISGGSIASQCVGIAVQRACEQLLERLEPIKAQMPLASWKEIIKKAFESDVQLQSHGFMKSTDVQQYSVCGACISEVVVDILTGQYNVERVDLIEDPGRTISPEIDIGQVEGAFVMGLGYWTSEQIVYNKENGEILTDRLWHYNVPQSRDIPEDFRVYLTNKWPSPDIILGTKAIGEPATCLAVSVPLAIRRAIVSARLECGLPANKWFNMDAPYSLDKILLACSTNTDDYKIY